MAEQVASKKEEEVIAELDAFAELPDAPPKRKFRLTWVGYASCAVVVFWLVICIIGPSIAPFHEMDMDGDDSFLPAGEGEYGHFYLGTDYLSRDTLSRVLYGARNTLGISLAATLIAYLIGITLGILAAVKGGWIDMGISRVNDAILALPTIMLGLIVIAALGSSIPILIGTAAVIYATSVFRIARALGQDIMVQDFVEAAQTRGEGIWWIIRAEVLPNAAMPLATDFGLRLVFVVLFISSLSFLGLGVPSSIPTWGRIVADGREYVADEWWIAFFPGLAILITVMGINLLGDWLREDLDPKRKNR